jgi:DNA invertase Pin-like site-specific DNA recombinase
MLPDTAASKVTAAHLSRTALLYVRQSSLKQVIHNTESAIRQYDLRGKAIALGWAADQITVIDIDQGHSGASAADREGFQHLVAEVSLGRAGIVLGLECSRLARNSADWHQLLELCGMTGTLICDEDGLYDPRNFNDRLLLGLKGALSEAELHFIRARLRGGIISKARRGELITPLPVGLAYDAAGHVTLDPDTGGPPLPWTVTTLGSLGTGGTPMVTKYQKFGDGYKAEAVKLYRESNQTIAETARNLGLKESTLANWVKKDKDNEAVAVGEAPLTPAERTRIRELEADVRRLNMENAFLKKASAYFASQNL